MLLETNNTSIRCCIYYIHMYWKKKHDILVKSLPPCKICRPYNKLHAFSYYDTHSVKFFFSKLTGMWFLKSNWTWSVYSADNSTQSPFIDFIVRPLCWKNGNTVPSLRSPWHLRDFSFHLSIFSQAVNEPGLWGPHWAADHSLGAPRWSGRARSIGLRENYAKFHPGRKRNLTRWPWKYYVLCSVCMKQGLSTFFGCKIKLFNDYELSMLMMLTGQLYKTMVIKGN